MSGPSSHLMWNDRIIAQQFRTVEVNLEKMLKNISPLLCEIMFNDIILNTLIGGKEVNLCKKM